MVDQQVYKISPALPESHPKSKVSSSQFITEQPTEFETSSSVDGDLNVDGLSSVVVMAIDNILLIDEELAECQAKIEKLKARRNSQLAIIAAERLVKAAQEAQAPSASAAATTPDDPSEPEV